LPFSSKTQGASRAVNCCQCSCSTTSITPNHSNLSASYPLLPVENTRIAILRSLVLTTSQPMPDDHFIQLRPQAELVPPSTFSQISAGEDDPTDILLFAHDHRISFRPGEAGHSGSIASEDEFCGEMTVTKGRSRPVRYSSGMRRWCMQSSKKRMTH
jgi:hypothetical protein